MRKSIPALCGLVCVMACIAFMGGGLIALAILAL